jgi:NAD-dependent deacetylase
MRCSKECSEALQLLPDSLGATGRPKAALGVEERVLLDCPRCGAWMRPHVLWFDEVYDEPRYRFDTALDAATSSSLLLVIGTSGATSLPMHVGTIVARRGAALIDVDPEPNPFANLARSSAAGCFLRGRAADLVPIVVSGCVAAFAPDR